MPTTDVTVKVLRERIAALGTEHPCAAQAAKTLAYAEREARRSASQLRSEHEVRCEGQRLLARVAYWLEAVPA